MPEDSLSSRAPEPVGPYPHYRRAGGLLFLSGIGPRVRGVKEVPGVTLGADGRVASYDFERQCRQVGTFSSGDAETRSVTGTLMV